LQTPTPYILISVIQRVAIQEISTPDVRADYDEDGAIVAFTIEHASIRADLGSVDVRDVPHPRLISEKRAAVGH
jgi:uncharacterized protein YuzE